MATKYLRSGAGGTGSGNDHTNAYTNAQTAANALNRGDTLYVDDGTYTSITLSKAASGTTPITIKKAIESDHGAAGDWNSTFGDGQATFTDITYTTPYYIVDGQTGGGPGTPLVPTWITGFGFKAVNVDFSASNSTIRHTDVEAPGAGGTLTDDCFWWDAITDCTISYCYMHEAGRCLFFSNRSASRITVEYSCLGRFGNTIGTHCETGSLSADFSGVGCDDLVFRYCLMTWCESTGGIMVKGDNLQVYGCIFDGFNGDLSGFGNGLVGSWTAKTTSVPDLLTNGKFYNNTFIGFIVRCFGLYDGNGTPGAHPELYSTDNRNNLFYQATVGNDSQGWGAPGTHVHTHNYYNGSSDAPSAGSEPTREIGTGNPFQNLGAKDYRLTANTTAGVTLASPYEVDMYGTVRGSGGEVWTRGAIQFGTGGGEEPPPSATPVPVRGLVG